MACPAVQYFSTLTHKWHDFRGKVTGYKMCVLIFCTTFVWDISHSKKKWARYDQKCISVFMWSTAVLIRFQWNLNFLDRFFEKSSNIKFHENPSIGSRVVPCGRTAMKLIVAFRNFADAPKKPSTVLSCQIVSVKWHYALVNCMHMYLWHGTTKILQTMPICPTTPRAWYNSGVVWRSTGPK